MFGESRKMLCVKYHAPNILMVVDYLGRRLGQAAPASLEKQCSNPHPRMHRLCLEYYGWSMGTLRCSLTRGKGDVCDKLGGGMGDV